MRIDLSIVPLFGIDVQTSSKGIQFGSEFSGMETDDQIELMENSDQQA
jgi:hypothetical protein